MRATALGRPVGSRLVGGRHAGDRHAGDRRAGDSLASDHAHKLAILRAFFLKLDLPVFFRKQRVITSDAHIPACMDARAALPDDDIAGDHRLATK